MELIDAIIEENCMHCRFNCSGLCIFFDNNIATGVNHTIFSLSNCFCSIYHLSLTLDGVSKLIDIGQPLWIATSGDYAIVM